MQLMTDDGRLVATWDADEHPHWPPVDSDGEIIGDVPWKFFDPSTSPQSDRGPRKG